jgi:hypothetical protein
MQWRLACTATTTTCCSHGSSATSAIP